MPLRTFEFDSFSSIRFANPAAWIPFPLLPLVTLPRTSARLETWIQSLLFASAVQPSIAAPSYPTMPLRFCRATERTTRPLECDTPGWNPAAEVARRWRGLTDATALTLGHVVAPALHERAVTPASRPGRRGRPIAGSCGAVRRGTGGTARHQQNQPDASTPPGGACVSIGVLGRGHGRRYNGSSRCGRELAGPCHGPRPLSLYDEHHAHQRPSSRDPLTARVRR